MSGLTRPVIRRLGLDSAPQHSTLLPGLICAYPLWNLTAHHPDSELRAQAANPGMRIVGRMLLPRVRQLNWHHVRAFPQNAGNQASNLKFSTATDYDWLVTAGKVCPTALERDSGQRYPRLASPRFESWQSLSSKNRQTSALHRSEAGCWNVHCSPANIE